MPVFVISPHTGLLAPGTIDLTRRPIVVNRDGSISTVRTVLWTLDRPECSRCIPWGKIGRSRVTLAVPTVVGNRIISDRAAINHACGTGAHLGVFDTVPHAKAYANALHRWQERYYRSKRPKARA